VNRTKSKEETGRETKCSSWDQEEHSFPSIKSEISGKQNDIKRRNRRGSERLLLGSGKNIFSIYTIGKIR
jgi:hypothetical protein